MHLLTTLTAALLPSLILALPSPSLLTPRADSPCTPTSYTLSAYTLVTSATSASVNFAFQSHFAASSTGIVDPVTIGANCATNGPSIPNNNVCGVAERRLLFDLRGPQEQAYYQLTHTWVCDGATWMSGTPVQIDPLRCTNDGTKRTCSGGPQTIVPQNVRKICNAPRC